MMLFVMKLYSENLWGCHIFHNKRSVLFLCKVNGCYWNDYARSKSSLVIENLYIQPASPLIPSLITFKCPRNCCKVLWCVCFLNEIAFWWEISPHFLSSWPQEDCQDTQGKVQGWWNVWFLGLHTHRLEKLSKEMAGIVQKQSKGLWTNCGAWSIVRLFAMVLVACIIRQCWVTECSCHSESSTIVGFVGQQNVRRIGADQ